MIMNDNWFTCCLSKDSSQPFLHCVWWCLSLDWGAPCVFPPRRRSPVMGKDLYVAGKSCDIQHQPELVLSPRCLNHQQYAIDEGCFLIRWLSSFRPWQIGCFAMIVNHQLQIAILEIWSWKMHVRARCLDSRFSENTIRSDDFSPVTSGCKEQCFTESTWAHGSGCY